MSASYDVIVIGAGFSGLAAALRLGRFGKRVAVLEAHVVPGGLNSFYFRRPGASIYNAGLHTVTNFDASDPRWGRGYLCRALDLAPEKFELKAPLLPARIVTPTRAVAFTAGGEDLFAELARLFPGDAHGLEEFRARVLAKRVAPEDYATPAEQVLESLLKSREAIDLLRIPVYLYGGYAERSVSWHVFRVIFRSLVMDGFCSPANIKVLLDLFTAEVKASGGAIFYRQRVAGFLRDGDKVAGVVTAEGAEYRAPHVISSMGEIETRQLLGEKVPADNDSISAFETTFVFDGPTREAGVESSLLFASDEQPFTWRIPRALPEKFEHFTVSAADCYEGLEATGPHHLKVGTYVKGDAWIDLPAELYAAKKAAHEAMLQERLRALMPNVDFSRVVRTESATPRSVRRYTGHMNGAIYGASQKNFLGSVGLKNLTLCGNDRGGIGIMGAAINGVIAANLDVLMAK